MKAILYQPVTDLRSSVCYKLYQIICTWTPHLLIRAYSHFIEFNLLFYFEKSQIEDDVIIFDFLIWPWSLMCINYMISLVRYKSISFWCFNELFVRKKQYLYYKYTSVKYQFRTTRTVHQFTSVCRCYIVPHSVFSSILLHQISFGN